MNKPLLIIGLLVIGGMLLVPPKEVTTYDGYGAAADELIGGDRVTAYQRVRSFSLYKAKRPRNRRFQAFRGVLWGQ